MQIQQIRNATMRITYSGKLFDELGFRNVIPVGESFNWNGIEIIRTPAQHGTGDVLKEMGNTSGFVLQSKDEPTIYWTGDTIFCDAVDDVITQIQPDIIITHSCGAVWGDNVLIVMDAVQTIAVCRAAPKAIVVASHMEALDHATISRSDLRTIADKEGINPSQLLIPFDGEILRF
jgi:L-ascorbate metabolism protein UlaG (beta-lactamase superfamily)